MAVFTPDQMADLDALETRVIGFYARMLHARHDPEIVAGALRLECEQNPMLGRSQGLGLHECKRAFCGNVTDEPVRDEVSQWWVGDDADTFCSQSCLERAAEDYWCGRVESAYSA